MPVVVECHSAPSCCSAADVDGKTHFKADASLFSLHGTRRLLDDKGAPVLDLKQKLLTLHGTWLVLDNKGKKLAEIKPALVAIKPCEPLCAEQ